MNLEEIKVELKEYWSDKTFVEELVIDHERRIVHIYSEGGRDSLFPHDDIESGNISFSSAFTQYTEKVFNSYGYNDGLNKHTKKLKEIFSDLHNLYYTQPEEEHENFLSTRIKPIQVKIWINSWKWCFYSGGNNIYIYKDGFYSIFVPRLFETSENLLDLLYKPFRDRQVEIQNKYLNGQAGK